MKEDWIKDLKVGDEVIVHSGGWYDNSHIEKVQKINKATINVGGTLYNVDSGFERTSGWHISHITQCTPEAKEMLMLKRERQKLTAFLLKAKWDSIPIEDLREIQAIVLKNIQV